MTAPHPGAARRSHKLLLAFGVVLVVLAGGALGASMLAHGETAPPAAPTDTRLHVVDLMARAHCVGHPTNTQSYSYETGECDLNGSHVIIAVFENGERRDQWLTVARQFMDTFVAGVGWAAALDKPNAAGALAVALDGRVV